MTETVSFVALPFDFVDGSYIAGEPTECTSPAAAIQTAKGLWKVFGHTGAVAFSRTTDFEAGIFGSKHVFRRFGQVPQSEGVERSGISGSAPQLLD